MSIGSHYPYRSVEAREKYLALYDSMSMEWPIAAESRVVATGWGETFVRVGGPAGAPPLVLLPGFTSSSLIWTPNIAALSAQYRTFALDRNGDVGRSTCTRLMMSVDDIVSWLDQVFTVLAPATRMNLVGLSYGGWLTAQYALRFPNRLRSIVMIAPGATVLRTSPELFLRSFLLVTGSRSLARATIRWLLADLARENPARLEVSLDRLLAALKYRRLIRPIGPTVLKDSELNAVRTPALFLVGEHEKIYSAAKTVERLARVAPHIETEIVPGAGHDLTIAHAHRVCRRVLEFLDAVN
jgi:pimeloyl-ACP methyl ester carboxylesterase